MTSFKLPKKPIIITIDGPAGAGKTSISKLLAGKLGYRYLDTGALYRAVAVAAVDKGVAADDDAALEALCRELVIDLESSDSGHRRKYARSDWWSLAVGCCVGLATGDSVS